MSIKTALGETGSPKDELKKIFIIVSRLRTDIITKNIKVHLEVDPGGVSPLKHLIESINIYIACLNIAADSAKKLQKEFEYAIANVDDSIKEGYYKLDKHRFSNLLGYLHNVIKAKNLPRRHNCSYDLVSDATRSLWHLN